MTPIIFYHRCCHYATPWKLLWGPPGVCSQSDPQTIYKQMRNFKVPHQLHPSSFLTVLLALPLLQWLPLQVQELQTTSWRCRMLSCWPSFWRRWKASIEKIHLLKFFCWSFSVVAAWCVCVCVCVCVCGGRCKVSMNNS